MVGIPLTELCTYPHIEPGKQQVLRGLLLDLLQVRSEVLHRETGCDCSDQIFVGHETVPMTAGVHVAGPSGALDSHSKTC